MAFSILPVNGRVPFVRFVGWKIELNRAPLSEGELLDWAQKKYKNMVGQALWVQVSPEDRPRAERALTPLVQSWPRIDLRLVGPSFPACAKKRTGNRRIRMMDGPPLLAELRVSFNYGFYRARLQIFSGTPYRSEYRNLSEARARMGEFFGEQPAQAGANACLQQSTEPALPLSDCKQLQTVAESLFSNPAGSRRRGERSPLHSLPLFARTVHLSQFDRVRRTRRFRTKLNS